MKKGVGRGDYWSRFYSSVLRARINIHSAHIILFNVLRAYWYIFNNYHIMTWKLFIVKSKCNEFNTKFFPWYDMIKTKVLLGDFHEYNDILIQFAPFNWIFVLWKEIGNIWEKKKKIVGAGRNQPNITFVGNLEAPTGNPQPPNTLLRSFPGRSIGLYGVHLPIFMAYFK